MQGEATGLLSERGCRVPKRSRNRQRRRSDSTQALQQPPFLVFPRKVATPAMLASALPSKNNDPGSGTVVGAPDARRSPDSEPVITFAGRQVPFGQKNC